MSKTSKRQGKRFCQETQTPESLHALRDKLDVNKRRLYLGHSGSLTAIELIKLVREPEPTSRLLHGLYELFCLTFFQKETNTTATQISAS